MTVTPSIDPARLLEEQLAQASPDLLRELLTTFINTLVSAEADAVCGAAYGATSPERTTRRNGYRNREFDTRAGTIELAIPKLRQDGAGWLGFFRDLTARGLSGVELPLRRGAQEPLCIDARTGQLERSAGRHRTPGRAPAVVRLQPARRPPRDSEPSRRARKCLLPPPLRRRHRQSR